jgi:propanediol utilization protein
MIEILDDRDREQLSADVNPAERTLIIDESAQRIEPQYCCEHCRDSDPLDCDCNCCECPSEACT